MILNTIQSIFRYIQEVVFLYPFAMSWIWMVGALLYYFVWEKRRIGPDESMELSYEAFVTILVPCFNEGKLIEETIGSLAKTNYPYQWEVIAINDGSSDDTADRLNKLSGKYSFLKVIHLAENKGKALALKTGSLMAKGKYIVCIDGDALLEPNAVTTLVATLQQRPRIGAVTGNPRIRNRTTLLGKLQVGEFTTIIGLIKRTQMTYGKIFTVSGVVAAFRKRALHDIGYWSPDMITDDIDITWNLQSSGWFVLFQPAAMCWILMPETLKGLWRQRLRWAQGSGEATLKYGLSLFSKKGWRMLPLLFEYTLSLIWAHSVLITVILSVFELITMYKIETGVASFIPSHWAVILGLTFFLQSTVSMFLERRYEPTMYRHLLWMIWYPIAFWTITAMTAVFGFYRAILFGRKGLATWISPDRGVS